MRKSGGTRWRWAVVVPLAALVAWGVGWTLSRITRKDPRTLEVTSPPQTHLPVIVSPPRARFLSGTVIGPDGVAIDDALVALIASDEPHWTYTDKDGRFALEGLARGAWTVTISATAHLPFTTTISDDGTPVVVRLPDAKRPLPQLAPRVVAAIAGHIAPAPMTTLAGLEVVFTPTTPLQQIDAPLPRRVLCGSDGRFALPDLQIGEYKVVVLPEWAQNGTWPDLSRAEGTPPRIWNQTSGTEDTLDIELVAGGVRGIVADRERNPLAGALVLVASATAPERVWPPVTADAQGAFAIPDLPPADYVVTVRAGAGSHQATVTVRAREVLDLTLPPLSVEQTR
ncbi:MAG: carboxypeptidase regulatory-like domain-containing protein [Planctomycetes bacterium]|nr:carboxypeptidase regulatory-like domain-containing protein [Planctomycetota bacterium]